MKKAGFSITGCPKCGDPSTGLCNKHKLEYLKYCADTARNEYEVELKEQNERKQNELSSS